MPPFPTSSGGAGSGSAGHLPYPLWDSHLIGHARVRGLLTRAREAGKVPQVILLEGCEGVGKTTLAKAWACVLLGIPAEADVLAHPDMVWLAPAQVGEGIKVEAAQEAGERMAQAPWAGGWKVLIVEGVDTCTEKAANALLKRIEEPSGQTCIILIAHRPALVLPTIRSRAVAYSLFPLSGTELAEALVQRGAPAARLPRLLALAGGRPGLALRAMTSPEAMAMAETQAGRAAAALQASPAGRVAAGQAWLPPRAGAPALARAELLAVAEQWMWQLRDEYLKGVGLTSAATDPHAPMRLSAQEACRLLPQAAQLMQSVRGNVHPPLALVKAMM